MEKLWTTTEVAKYLGLSEEDVERLALEGTLTGYKLGGEFLRFRPDQVKRLQERLGGRRPAEASATTGKPPSPAARSATGAASWQERVRDFLYFYDFYLLSFLLLIGVMIYLMSSG